MKKNISSLLFVLFLALFCQYGFGMKSFDSIVPSVSDTISFKALGKLNNSVIIINDTIDLQGKKCVVPSNITLFFKRGMIKNGVLEGNMTQLKSSNACFNKVRIQGTWDVPYISTTLFSDLDYDNSLKDVVALTHPSVKNRIEIGEGTYRVSALMNNDICIPINSNTELIINGSIVLSPNAYGSYQIIQASGQNINISGKGGIVGDKHTHTGKEGEWGMGIYLKDAHHTTISGINIRDCWGDCIYVGYNSTDILIKDCKLDHGRRQGISITSGTGIVIKDCVITNVRGTAPEYAIDIEPNKGGQVEDVLIDNVRSSKCMGGLMAGCYHSDARIGKVTILNCTISAEKDFAIKLDNCDTAIIKKNIVDQPNLKRVIVVKDVNNLVLTSNKLGKKTDFHVIINCKNTEIKDNIGFR